MVLTKKVFAVVIAIGCADDGVNMVTRGDSRPVDRDRLLVIELDQDDGTLDAVIKDAVILGLPDPGKPGLVQVFPDLGHLHLGVTLSHVADVDLDKGKQPLLSFLGKLLRGQADQIKLEVVEEGFGNGVGAVLLRTENGLRPLLAGKGIDEGKPLVLFLLANNGALELAPLRFDRFGSHENRGHDHLIAQNEIIDHHVMAIQLPTPRLG
ncbi:uncharacterized protein METZ01_LOCUS366567, partial [marine metagenome]